MISLPSNPSFGEKSRSHPKEISREKQKANENVNKSEKRICSLSNKLTFMKNKKL